MRWRMFACYVVRMLHSFVSLACFAVVLRCQVRHFHSLGRVFGACLGYPRQVMPLAVQRAPALVFKFLFRRYAEWYWLSAIHPGEQFADSRAYHQQNYAGTDYMDMADGFRAELFNASYWADLFYRSGAKYIVPTSKHHDGFALWPSVHASRAYGRPWNAVDVGPKRDLIGEIAAAVRARGLKFGIYYSLYEWFHPLWRPEEEGTVADFVSTHSLPQLKDVVQRYAPSLIFSDGNQSINQSINQSVTESIRRVGPAVALLALGGIFGLALQRVPI